MESSGLTSKKGRQPEIIQRQHRQPKIIKKAKTVAEVADKKKVGNHLKPPTVEALMGQLPKLPTPTTEILKTEKYSNRPRIWPRV